MRVDDILRLSQDVIGDASSLIEIVPAQHQEILQIYRGDGQLGSGDVDESAVCLSVSFGHVEPFSNRSNPSLPSVQRASSVRSDVIKEARRPRND